MNIQKNHPVAGQDLPAQHMTTRELGIGGEKSAEVRHVVVDFDDPLAIALDEFGDAAKRRLGPLRNITEFLHKAAHANSVADNKQAAFKSALAYEFLWRELGSADR